MLLLVCENLLDEIAAGGIVSGRRCLRRRVEQGTRMALQRHVVVEYLADRGANGWRLDSERGCAVEIGEAIQKSIDRKRLIRSPHSHLAGKTFETPCFDESDMGLMLRVSAPRCAQQSIQDRKHRVGLFFFEVSQGGFLVEKCRCACPIQSDARYGSDQTRCV